MSDTQVTTIALVAKDVMMTNIMQSADLFEASKFIGCLIHVECTHTLELEGDALAERLLEEFHRVSADAEQVVVALCVHGGGWAALPGHRSVSDGYKWTLLSNVAEAYGKLDPSQETVPCK